MGVLDLLTQTATIYYNNSVTTDDNGLPVAAWALLATEPCRVNEQEGTETIGETAAAIKRVVIYLAPTSQATERMRIEVSGARFDVDSVETFYERGGSLNHKRAHCRRAL